MNYILPLLTSLFFMISPLWAQQTAVPLVISNIEIKTNNHLTTLTLHVNGPLQARVFALAHPNRLIVDLPEVNFQVPPSVGERSLHEAVLSGVVLAFRFGLFTKGHSRIVIDLARPAHITRTFMENNQFIMEIVPMDPAAFDALVQTSALPPLKETSPSLPQETSPKIIKTKPIIVLDPGHGGVDSGAVGPHHVIEKNLTLAFAKVLKDKLESTGAYQVLLTRDHDVFVSLKERVRFAQAVHADLLISLHGDMYEAPADVSGATIYTLSEKASDAQAARLADTENSADSAGGLETHADQGEVSDILFDLTKKETRTKSHLFARSLVNYWKIQGHLNKNPLRSAGFMVLKAPDIPSVLLELGYVSSPKDAAEFLSPEWQEKTAALITLSVEDFFQNRRNPPPVEKIGETLLLRR